MKLGGHCGYDTNSSLNELIQNCQKVGWNTCQIFFGTDSDIKNRKKLTFDDTNKCIQLCSDNTFDLYTHFPYKMNLVKPKTKAQLSGLQHELDSLAPFNGKVVIHPNSPTIPNGPTNKQTSHPNYISQYTSAIKVMIANLKLLKFLKPYSLLLEPPAGEGQKIGWSFDQMELIAKLLKEESLEVGFCIDTCHAFAAGLSKFDTKDEVDLFFNKLAKINVLDLVKVIHLNDSMCSFGSMKDKHDLLTNGYIWKDKENGLLAFVNKCKELNIDIICETGAIVGVPICKELLN